MKDLNINWRDYWRKLCQRDCYQNFGTWPRGGISIWTSVAFQFPLAVSFRSLLKVPCSLITNPCMLNLTKENWRNLCLRAEWLSKSFQHGREKGLSIWSVFPSKFSCNFYTCCSRLPCKLVHYIFACWVEVKTEERTESLIVLWLKVYLANDRISCGFWVE